MHRFVAHRAALRSSLTAGGVAAHHAVRVLNGSGCVQGKSIHTFSPDTGDASAHVGTADDVSSYSSTAHTGYLLLHSRRLWLPLLMGIGYFALGPVLTAAGSSAAVQQGLYLSICLLLQRLSVRGRMNREVKDMRGYVCVVTGGTSGIGLYTAMQLLDVGAHVVIASRPGKEEQTMDFFKRNCKTLGTSHPRNGDISNAQPRTDSELLLPLEKRVTFVAMDYSDQANIVVAAARIKSLFQDRVDLLVNCAGVWTEEPGLTKQGYEEHIGVNFLGPFHFTEALLPSLRRSQKKCGRIVYVTCASHNGVRTANVVRDRMLLKPSPAEDQITARCYSASKLGNIYHAQSIAARRYEGVPLNRPSDMHPVDVCCADPGFCFTPTTTGSGKNPLLGNGVLGRTVRSLWIKDAYEGSQTVFNCCVRGGVDNGGYYAECALMPSGLSRRAQDARARDEVVKWAMAKTIAKYYTVSSRSATRAS